MKKSMLFAIGLCLGATAGCSSAPVVEGTAGCNSPLGFIAEGQTATGYLRAVESSGQSCQQGVLTCEDGKWTGAYIYPSCVVTQ